MFVFVLISILSFSHSGLCEVNGTWTRERIVEGVQVEITSRPYQISLQLNGQHLCGGSIIGPSYVLTAAHCLQGTNSPSAFTVRAGSTSRSSGGQARTVQGYASHPWYNPVTKDYDYGLLQVSTSFVYNSAVYPITMNSNLNPKAGTSFSVSGWGVLSQTGTVAPEKLRAVELIVFDWSICNQRYDYSLTNRMICATAPQKGSCYGDSGGPGVVVSNGQAILNGIVSFGVTCANDNYPSVFSNVAVARSWIKGLIGI